MKPFHFLLLLALVISLTSNAQSYQKTSLGLKTTIHSVDIEIQFYSPSIVRVTKWPAGKTFTKESLSVVKTPQKTAFSISQQDDNLSLKSEKMIAVLNLKNGKVSFKTTESEPLLNEKESGASFTDFDDAGVKTFSVSQTYLLEKDETIYGLGILPNGKMSQRNQKLEMVQNNTWDFVTFFQSVKGYGLFWDNYSPTTFIDTLMKPPFVQKWAIASITILCSVAMPMV